MRNSNSKTIGAILKDFIKEQNLQPGLDKARIILAWPEVVGLNVARETLKVSVHNRVLFVSLRSAHRTLGTSHAPQGHCGSH